MDAKEKSPTSTGVHVNSSELGVGLEEDKPLDGVLGLVTVNFISFFPYSNSYLHRSPNNRQSKIRPSQFAVQPFKQWNFSLILST